MIRPILYSCFALLLGACASQPGAKAPEHAPQSAPASGEQADASATQAAEPPERALPADSLYPLLLAEFALRRRAYDTALDTYLEQAAKLRDPGVSAHTTHIAQVIQREQAALEAVQLWVELEPENLEANETLAKLLARAGRSLEAMPLLARIARAGEAANFPILLNRFSELEDEQQAQLLAGLGELSAEFPDSKTLLITRAIALDEVDQGDAALAVLEQLFALEPDQYQALLLEAKLRVERNEKDPLSHIRQVVLEQPDNSELRLQYARLLTREDIAAARAQFEILSARSPRDGNLLFSLALINHDIGDDLAARAYLRQLLDLGQRTDEAYYYLGRIAEKKGEWQDALSAYIAVADPAHKEFYNAKGRVGRILLDNNELQRSRTFFAGLREQHPEQIERLFLLEAELLLSKGLPR